MSDSLRVYHLRNYRNGYLHRAGAHTSFEVVSLIRNCGTSLYCEISVSSILGADRFNWTTVDQGG